MGRNRKKESHEPSYSSSSYRDKTEEKLAQPSVAEILSGPPTNASNANKSRFPVNTSRKSTSEAPSDRKGFLDLPSEIRNVIYHMISDHLKLGELYMYEDKGPTREIINTISTDVHKTAWPLAIVDVNRQIREEFLSLIIFGDAVAANITAEDLARSGPRNLNNPVYVNSFYVSSIMEFEAMYCPADTKSAKEVTSAKKNRCELCVSVGNISLNFAAKFEADSVGPYDANDDKVLKKRLTATFWFRFDNRYEFTQSSRSLIETTLAQVFRTNDDVSVASVVLAAERVVSLQLDAILVGSASWGTDKRTVKFKFIRAAKDTRPELWATRERDLTLARESLAESNKRLEDIEDMLRTKRKAVGVHSSQYVRGKKGKCKCCQGRQKEDTYTRRFETSKGLTMRPHKH